MSTLKKPTMILASLLAFVIIFGAVSFLFIDEPLALWMRAPDRAGFWLFNREITNIGESAHFFWITALTYISARWVAPKNLWLQKSKLNWPWLQEWSYQFFFSLIASGILVHILKFIAGRQRPHMSEVFENNIFLPFNNHWHWQSFPSGHSQTMFVVFVFICLMLPKYEKWIFFFCFYLALTRAFTHAHFVSDVISGSYIGFFGSVLILKYFQPRSRFLYSENFLKNSKNHSSSAVP